MTSALGFVFPAAAVGSGALLVKPRRGIFPAAAPNTANQGPPSEPIIAQVTIEEHHRDTLEITEHPVEQGAAITDHAYKRPAELTLRLGWSNSPAGITGLVGQAVSVAATLLGQAASIAAAAQPTYNAVQSLLTGNAPAQVIAAYNSLLRLQVSRIPFTVLTGKRRYDNMLMKSIGVVTDQTTENALAVICHLQEVIIVTTQTVSAVPADVSQQANPEKTQPTQQKGNQQLQDAPNYTSPFPPGAGP